MCPNHEILNAVWTQEDCQGLCEAKSESECVGIAFSHKTGEILCYLCKDDTIASAGNGYGFYRRPGNLKYFLYGWLTESWMKNTSVGSIK